jgi:hypothetical protein
MNPKGLAGGFQVFRVQETLLNQGFFQLSHGLLEGWLESHRQGHAFAGGHPVSFLVSRHVHPDINKAMAFKLGQGKENHFPGIFGDLTDGFGHLVPPMLKILS